MDSSLATESETEVVLLAKILKPALSQTKSMDTRKNCEEGLAVAMELNSFIRFHHHFRKRSEVLFGYRKPSLRSAQKQPNNS